MCRWKLWFVNFLVIFSLIRMKNLKFMAYTYKMIQVTDHWWLFKKWSESWIKRSLNYDMRNIFSRIMLTPGLMYFRNSCWISWCIFQKFLYSISKIFGLFKTYFRLNFRNYYLLQFFISISPFEREFHAVSTCLE